MRLLPKSFGKGTGILGAAEDGNRFAAAIVGFWMSLPFAVLAYVIGGWKYVTVVVVGFFVLGFLLPKLFTLVLRVLGAIASLIPH